MNAEIQSDSIYIYIYICGIYTFKPFEPDRDNSREGNSTIDLIIHKKM